VSRMISRLQLRAFPTASRTPSASRSTTSTDRTLNFPTLLYWCVGSSCASFTCTHVPIHVCVRFSV
jgi:hypothetical protein